MKKNLLFILLLLANFIAILIIVGKAVDTMFNSDNSYFQQKIELSEITPEIASDITSIIQKIPLTADQMVYESVQKVIFVLDDSALAIINHYLDFGNSSIEGTYYDGSVIINGQTYKLVNFGAVYSKESNAFINSGQIFINGKEVLNDADKKKALLSVEQSIVNDDYKTIVLDKWYITRYYNSEQRSYQGEIKSYQEWKDNNEFVDEGISANIIQKNGAQLIFDIGVDGNKDKQVNSFIYDNIEYNAASVQSQKELMASLDRLLVQ